MNEQSGVVPTTVRERQQVEAPQAHLTLPYRYVGTLKIGSTTPTIRNAERWIAANTGAVTVEDFLHGQPGQEIKILGDGQTTVEDNAKIKTNTGADKLLAADKVYTFTKFGSVWIEDV